MNINLDQIQNYFTSLPQDELYAYAAAFVGLVLVIIALIL